MNALTVGILAGIVALVMMLLVAAYDYLKDKKKAKDKNKKLEEAKRAKQDED